MIGNSNSALQIENLKSENIRKHVTILGVTGTYSSIPDAVDSGVFWTNPDEDGYWQDCEYVNYPVTTINSFGEKSSRVKRIKFTNCDGCSITNSFKNGNLYLEAIDMQNSGITALLNGAFRYCSFVSAVKLPASLTSIGDDVFSNVIMPYCDCTELTYTGSTPDTVMNGKSFQNTGYRLLFKDQATMNVYAQATNWSTYASRMTYVGAE